MKEILFFPYQTPTGHLYRKNDKISAEAADAPTTGALMVRTRFNDLLGLLGRPGAAIYIFNLTR